MKNISEHTITIEKDTVLCKQGDRSNDLYYLSKGLLMICSRSGRMVTPLAYIKAGEYFGELSFFDNLKRSADVISIEPSTLVKIPNDELRSQFPTWLLVIAKQMTKKLRLMDKVIADKGIKRTNVESIKPLDIEQQRYYYEVLENS